MSRGARQVMLGAVLALGLVVPASFFLARGIRSLAMTRPAVATYARLIAAANAQDLAAIRPLCSGRYLATHPLELAREGGVVGFPRQVHPNFQVWVQGAEVWLCPANRVGKVDRFVFESGRWKYDGPIGVLRSDGQVLAIPADPSPGGERP